MTVEELIVYKKDLENKIENQLSAFNALIKKSGANIGSVEFSILAGVNINVELNGVKHISQEIKV